MTGIGALTAVALIGIPLLPMAVLAGIPIWSIERHRIRPAPDRRDVGPAAARAGAVAAGGLTAVWFRRFGDPKAGARPRRIARRRRARSDVR
jgi:hypothetical protein